MPRTRTTRSDRLLEVVEPYSSIVIVMHDNPDPDAIASGWAIKLLLEAKTTKPVRLIAGGVIVRAENRHMVKLLQPPLELVDEFEPEIDTGIVLIDCGPEATNHLVSGELALPVAVIDHHDPQLLVRLPLLDVRPKVAASASIATAYLREQGLKPDVKLATALLYAIRTETRGNETHYSRLDRAVLPWLTKRADPTLLAEIIDAPLPPSYFSDLVLALQSTFIYEDVAFCTLPRAEGPEIIGEVADLLIRCEGVTRVCCAAVCDQSILMSARTDKSGGNATQLLRETIEGLGHCGGHTHRAGGKLAFVTSASKVPEDLQTELRSRFLSACGVQADQRQRLVAKREIVGNL